MDNIIAKNIGVKEGLEKSNRGDFLSRYTNNQWYCFQARQTVYYNVFSSEKLDELDLIKMAKNLIRLAPQLGTGFNGAIKDKPLSDDILKEIVSVKSVQSLDGYPEKFDMIADELFDKTDIPFFRIRAVVREDGKDDLGRQSMISIISTHALIEGADAALLSRSKALSKEIVSTKLKKNSKLQRILYNLTAAILAPLQLIVAEFLVPKKLDANYRALSIKREQIKNISEKLNISQRALVFALASYVLNNRGKGFSKKNINTIYADLDNASPFQTNDDYFNFRMVEMKLKYDDDFITYAKNVELAIKRVEEKNIAKTQALLNAMFATHRKLKKLMPFLYRGRVFRFSGKYHMSLSLLPPQRLFGRLTKGMIEPIYAGTFHPGINMCVFAPGRHYITFNFSVQNRFLKMIADLPILLDKTEQDLN